MGVATWPVGPVIVVFSLAVAAALIALCLALDKLRSRSTAVDRSYRLIFS